VQCADMLYRIAMPSLKTMHLPITQSNLQVCNKSLLMVMRCPHEHACHFHCVALRRLPHKQTLVWGKHPGCHCGRHLGWQPLWQPVETRGSVVAAKVATSCGALCGGHGPRFAQPRRHSPIAPTSPTSPTSFLLCQLAANASCCLMPHRSRQIEGDTHVTGHRA